MQIDYAHSKAYKTEPPGNPGGYILILYTDIKIVLKKPDFHFFSFIIFLKESKKEIKCRLYLQMQILQVTI